MVGANKKIKGSTTFLLPREEDSRKITFSMRHAEKKSQGKAFHEGISCNDK